MVDIYYNILNIILGIQGEKSDMMVRELQKCK